MTWCGLGHAAALPRLMVWAPLGGPTGGSSRSLAAGIEESQPLHTHSCTNYLIMRTLMGKKQVSWTYKADVGSHFQAAWLKWATDGWGKKNKNLSRCFNISSKLWITVLSVVWKDDSFLVGKHTEGNTVSYTSEKMWSSSDRAQMLLRNML